MSCCALTAAALRPCSSGRGATTRSSTPTPGARKAFPGPAIFVTTLAINLIGNALRDWLDPHMNL
jgi:hypothetical protein